ncbi:glycoside hydrolase family 16 protein [Vararia minispora EC-137]|uniref:Glycoside hydrolase family 16 protein n=1 Tax=Vararia minispora EC-137 TaxID=1314806 RepID=A0ACB8QLH9_9AGAM|nr:glycoside hydrolase family 16 protein [Vararia minispora EC-137]
MIVRAAVGLCVLAIALQVAAYDVVREYSGNTFFDRWDFYGSWDNLTLGDVWWQDRATAMSTGLAYVNEAGSAIMKVDNTTNVPFNDKRNSIRITTQDFYGVGSLWIVDITHIPYGCSVWPAFWTKGPTWPDNGEIDIIEGINLNTNNQYALHTTGGCFKDASAIQTGATGVTDCSQPSGCVVQETGRNSYREGFAAAGGGVWATQFDVAGIFIWFWSRPNIPASILQATSTSPIDVSDFGVPSASYPVSRCNIPQYFTAQQIVFDITLCGNWAGIPSLYQAQCLNQGPTGTCYQDNVVGSGSPKYDEAYFEVKYLRAYTTGAPAPTPASGGIASGSSLVATFASVPEPTIIPTSLPGGINTSPNGSSAGLITADVWKGIILASTVGIGLVLVLLIL